MHNAPVYLINSSNPSGWIIAVTTALVTAFATFGIGILIEDYKRHRDRRTFAASILAEVTMCSEILLALKQDNFEEITQAWQTVDKTSGTYKGLPFIVISGLTSVWMGNIDKTGILGEDLCKELSGFYFRVNIISNYINNCLSENSLVAKQRLHFMDISLKQAENILSKTSSLQDKLKSVVKASWLGFLAGRPR